MYVKKVKRKCAVRGCTNTDSYAISLKHEVGNTVIICKSCLGKALGAIDDVSEETKTNIPIVKREAPKLFFNRVACKASDADEAIVKPASGSEGEEAEAEETKAQEFICPNCKRVFASQKGLNMHLKSCIAESEE